MSVTGMITGPLLERILARLADGVDVLVAFFRNDRKLRAAQSENEPLADGFQQGSNNGHDTTTYPLGNPAGVEEFTIFRDGQNNTAKQYSYIEVLIEDSSGEGRYTIEGGLQPTAAGFGHKIPAGGTTITIPGVENIKQFKMIAATGQTLTYTMQGFV